MSIPAPRLSSENLRLLAGGITVRSIASSPLLSCDGDEQVSAVLASPQHRGIDRIPVRVGGDLLGVLVRGVTAYGGLARVAMQPLRDSMLVSGDLPLHRLLDEFTASDFRLVVDGARVNAIVTRSDLLKLPVRMYAFALITQLEMNMANVIRRKITSDDDWLCGLTELRRAKVLNKQTALRKSSDDPPLLELTEFADKRDLAVKFAKLPREFTHEMKEIERVRNKLAHSGDYAPSGAALDRFVISLRNTKKWLDVLEELPIGRGSGGAS